MPNVADYCANCIYVCNICRIDLIKNKAINIAISKENSIFALLNINAQCKLNRMSELEIKNIGPIKYVKFNTNKINVFIGPQSSGKSTIAKLISFCEWIEKDIVAHQNKDYISAEFLNVNLYGFHKMKSYFNETSYIKYTSDAICFEFTSLNNFKIELLENFKNAQIGKVAYVPSERNIVSVPNISSFPMEENYIRNYIFDWLNIKRK